MTNPVCSIIAGPNGAGKTTFALDYLPDFANVERFINADLIAAGLSPLAPEKETLAASRLFLTEIEDSVSRRENFAFETTLSGKTYLRLIKRLRQQQWKIHLFYLWLPNAEMSAARVAERVASGGHDIPKEAIKRRYPRSVKNLIHCYQPLSDATFCFDNSADEPQLVYIASEQTTDVLNQTLYQNILEVANS